MHYITCRISPKKIPPTDPGQLFQHQSLLERRLPLPASRDEACHPVPPPLSLSAPRRPSSSSAARSSTRPDVAPSSPPRMRASLSGRDAIGEASARLTASGAPPSMRRTTMSVCTSVTMRRPSRSRSQKPPCLGHSSSSRH